MKVKQKYKKPTVSHVVMRTVCILEGSKSNIEKLDIEEDFNWDDETNNPSQS